MKWLVLPCSALLLCNPVFAQTWHIDTFAEHFSYSESLPVWSLLDSNYRGPYRDGSQAFSQSRLGMTAHWERWSLSLLRRHDAFTRYSPQTAELLYREENDLELQDQAYQVDLRLEMLDAYGLGASYRFDISPTLQLLTTPYFWLGTDTLSGRLAGSATVTDGQYSVHFVTDYHYNDDPLFDRDTEQVQGWGASLDLALTWQLSEQLDLHLQARDLFNRFYWPDLARTQARGNTSNQALDEDGNISYRPVLSGVESNQTYTQRLPEQYRLALDLQRAGYRVSAGARYLDRQLFPELTTGVPLGAANQLTAGYRLTSGAFSIGYVSPTWSLTFFTSDWPLDRAKSLGLDLSVNLNRLLGVGDTLKKLATTIW